MIVRHQAAVAGAVGALLLLLVAGAPAAACEFVYTLIGPDGEERSIETSNTTTLREGAAYTLRMAYREDHRNCNIGPEDTLYLLDGARWRLERETQPLVLTTEPAWNQPSSRSHVGELQFTAATAGEWSLELIRTCHRDGYAGTLRFVVEEN